MRLLLSLLVVSIAVTSAPAAAAQETGEEMRVALIVPITSDALFTPAGRPARDAADRLTSLADSLTQLTRPDLAEIPLALSPSPVFCDEVMRFGGPVAARLRGLLRQLAARLPTLSAPYASVLLPHLATADAVTEEIASGVGVLEQCLGSGPIPVVNPPDLALDRESVRGAVEAGRPTLLGPAERLPRGGATIGGATLMPTHAVAPGDAPNDALVPLQNENLVALVVDLVRPDLATFVTALANDPRVALRPITDLITQPADQFVSFPAFDEPPRRYGSVVREAETALRRFRSYTLRDNRLGAILATAVGRARSTSEWDKNWSVGEQRARAVTTTIARQEDLVSAAEGAVTFTSRRGSVPLTVTNGATYPVRVRISLASSKLSFPDGADRVVTVDPPGDTTVFAALARSTGTFPVQARVTSADGEIVFHSGELTVRSTAANLPALILTAGGAVFLVGWTGRQLRRRRKAREA